MNSSMLKFSRYGLNANNSQQFLDQIGSSRSINLKVIRQRIKAITNIRKITKTMKMIASARLKAAENRVKDSRPFANTVLRPLNEIKPAENDQVQSHLILALSSDRGLCGGVNSQVAKATRVLASSEKAAVSIACLGEKVAVATQREYSSKYVLTVKESSKRPMNFAGASAIVDALFADGQYDKISLISNHFVSIISFTPEVRSVLGYPALERMLQKGTGQLEKYDFEDDSTYAHVRDLQEFHLASLIFNGYMENTAAELGARMASMDNATRNAGEVIKKLTTQYNRGRQAAITTELSEIISGAEALVQVND